MSLQELRMVELQLPTAKDENYRYVSLRDVAWTKQDSTTVLKEVLPEDWSSIDADQGLRVLLQGAYAKPQVLEDKDFKGVQLSVEARPVFEKFKDDFFCGLIGEEKTLVVKVPRGFNSKKVLRLSDVVASGVPTTIHRCVIEVAEQVDLVIHNDLSNEKKANDHKSSFVSILHFEIADESRVKFFIDQSLTTSTAFAFRHSAVVGKNSTLSYWGYHKGASRGQHRVECIVAGEGGHSEVKLGVRAQNKDAIDIWAQNYHNVKNTTSDTKVWNVLEDEAIVVFNGNIDIGIEGLYTQAYQSNKNLLLSDKAQVHSMPKLEISTDDVKCSHGATIASLDSDQLFYLQSRGIDGPTSEKILVDAFGYTVLSEIPLGSVRNRYLGDEGDFL